MAVDNELQALLREMHSTINVLDERTRSILVQTEKTNGKVLRLEDKVDKVEKVQDGLVVKVGAFVTFAAVFVSIAVKKVFNI